MCSIQFLPNEIIYRIFNNIDTTSIISFSLTCKRFYDCLNNYNSYRLNFTSITKTEFDHTCRFINPYNVISLKLSDDDKTPGQIKEFIKNVRLNKFSRLNSLELVEINENDLEKILINFLNNSINSIHIEYRKYFQLLNKRTIDVLHKILSLNNLNQVNLDMRACQDDYVQWPNSSNIQCLTLKHSNSKQFHQIIEKSNKFYSINLINFTMNNNNYQNSKTIDLHQLKTLKIEDSELDMNYIRSCIFLMKNLHYLKLEGYTNIIDDLFRNNQIESMFQMNLIHLKQFQFFIRFSPNEFQRNRTFIQILIEQFQRDYWITKLNCFVNCDLVLNSNQFHFYSLPCSYTYFKYSDQIQMSSLTTLSTSNYIEQRFHFISHLDLNLKDLQILSTNINTNQKLFPQLKNLKLTINDRCSSDCFENVSSSIHLGKITKIVLIISSQGNYLNEIIDKFLFFIQKLLDLYSIEIFNRWHGIFSFVSIKHFCSMIPNRIKYLDIDISDVNQIKILIERLRQISSFKFRYSFEKAIYIKDVLQWIEENRKNSTSITDIHYLSVWISNQRNPCKRIKL